MDQNNVLKIASLHLVEMEVSTTSISGDFGKAWRQQQKIRTNILDQKIFNIT